MSEDRRPPDDSSPGKRLGDFEVLRELGRGGMGIVYEARQVSLNRLVALKVLPPGLGLTDTAVQRFEREARAAAKLHHTNIVPVFATGPFFPDATLFDSSCPTKRARCRWNEVSGSKVFPRLVADSMCPSAQHIALQSDFLSAPRLSLLPWECAGSAYQRPG